jgi:hypothetical protein
MAGFDIYVNPNKAASHLLYVDVQSDLVRAMRYPTTASHVYARARVQHKCGTGKNPIGRSNRQHRRRLSSGGHDECLYS